MYIWSGGEYATYTTPPLPRGSLYGSQLCRNKTEKPRHTATCDIGNWCSGYGAVGITMTSRSVPVKCLFELCKPAQIHSAN